jgi:hypothetical protein
VLVALASAVTLVALVVAGPAAADPPTAVPFEFVFEDVNPSVISNPSDGRRT